MVEGPGGAAGGGNPPNDAANGAGTGAGSGGTGGGNGGGGAPPSGGAAGAAGSPAGLDRSKLNPVLAALDEQQLNEAFDAMFQAARANGDRVRGSEPSREEAPPAPKLPTAEEIRRKFDPNDELFDPMSVIQQYTEAQYGPLLTGIAGRTTANMIANFRQQIPDFVDYEADVLRVLQGTDPRTLTTEQVVGAYYAAKGARITQKEIEERRKPPKTSEPSPRHEDGEPKVKLTPEEQTAARKLFRHAADPEAAYIKAQSLVTGDFEVKVPLGGGKNG